MANENVLFGPGADPEEAAIRQRLQYAQTLRQSQTPMQGRMVGDRFVGASPVEGLANLLKSYGGRVGEEQAMQQAGALNQQRKAEGAADLQGYVNALRGTAAKPGLDGDDGAYVPPQEATAGDPQKAMALALASRNPVLQQAGLSQIKEMTAAPKWTKAERPKADGSMETGYINENSRAPWDTFQVGGTAPVKGVAVNGQLVNPTSGGKIGEAIPEQLKPDSVVTRDGSGALVPNMPVVSARAAVAAAGKPSVTSTVINAGPKEFEKQLGELDAKQLGKWRDSAEAANNALGVVQNLRNAEKQGAYSGAGADQKLAAARVIETLTGSTPKGQVGSELYNSESKKLVLEHIKTLGANPSNADRDFIEKTVPQLATSAQARTAMADFMERKARAQIDLYQRADAHARTNHGLGGFQQFSPAAAPAGNGFKILEVK